MLNDKVILITGGTGSFGNTFLERVLTKYSPRKVIIYSRDEYKQFVMKQSLEEKFPKQLLDKVRFFIGDVRDKDRLYRALDGVDYVIHAAALKHVPVCEYNPFEAIKTNIHGAQNVIDAAIDRKVRKVVALSTDKAVNPVNLYGATKLASDKLFVAANAYSAKRDTTFSVVRYGNVSGSRGSVIPFFRALKEKGVKKLPVTDFRMTRFWIELDEAVDLVLKAIDESLGGEVYISKIPSYHVKDLAKAIYPECELEEVGIREGEKLHEAMITSTDSFHTYEYEKHFIIYPAFEWCNHEEQVFPGGRKVQQLMEYSSDKNNMWLNVEDLKNKLAYV